MGSNALNLAQAIEQRANSLVNQIYYAYGYTQNVQTPGASGPWRPPEWVGKNPIFSILPTDASEAFVFDGPMEISHEQQSVVTLNPIQTGAPIADHAYVVPARLTARLMMSDSMQSYSVNQFYDGTSRSVSAWQQLKLWQRTNTFLAVATRLNQYDNMLITGMSALEEKETRFAGKFTVTFTQILTASLGIAESGIVVDPNDTTDPQVAVETPVGQLNPQPIPAAINQNNVENSSRDLSLGSYSPGTLTLGNRSGSSVLGAGTYSSTPLTLGTYVQPPLTLGQ